MWNDQGLDPDGPIMLCRERVSAAVSRAVDKESAKKVNRGEISTGARADEHGFVNATLAFSEPGTGDDYALSRVAALAGSRVPLSLGPGHSFIRLRPSGFRAGGSARYQAKVLGHLSRLKRVGRTVSRVSPLPATALRSSGRLEISLSGLPEGAGEARGL